VLSSNPLRPTVVVLSRVTSPMGWTRRESSVLPASDKLPQSSLSRVASDTPRLIYARCQLDLQSLRSWLLLASKELESPWKE